MSATTSIEWTDRSWNPVRGCSLVSEGCRSCYAMKVAHRFSGPGKPYDGLTRIGPNGPTWTGAVRCIPEALDEPLRWKKPQRIFVNSMSDLFHEDVPDAFIDQVFAVMALASTHTFQVLTKRAERMRAYLSDRTVALRAAEASIGFGVADLPRTWPLSNVWLGVSVENQHFADERIPLLLSTPAAVRFISAEPLLGPVDLEHIYMAEYHYIKDALRRSDLEPPRVPDAKLDWVISGGESGHGARPFEVAWARSIIRQCEDAGVACFVKQLGAVPLVQAGRLRYWEWRGMKRPEDKQFTSHADCVWRVHLSDPKGGDMSEWPEDLRVRQFPEVARD